MDSSQGAMPAVLDRQIDSDDKDAFGHRHLAQALRSLVESDHHKPPFSIGLLGGWGTGKSSIKELYTRNLEIDALVAPGKPPRKDRFKSITFNAWRFGGKDQDIKRALLRHVFLELGGDEQELHDRLFKNITQVEHQWKGWRDYSAQLWRSWAMPLPAFIGAILLLFGLISLGLWLLPWADRAAQSVFVLAISGAYSYLLKNLKPSKVESYRSITKVSLPSASAEQYEAMLLEQLDVFKQKTEGILCRPNPCERLVIFVDDLDRLSSEEMVLGLDAVRAFMEIPFDKLPDGLGLVFVISCDEAKVADALARGRGNPEHPGSVVTQMDARRYLDRIFQFRLDIPPPPRGDMRLFALKHLAAFEDIAADLKARGTTPEEIIDRMIHVKVVDPRNALQIVNAFAQSWWLAKRREHEGVTGSRPGGLHENAVTGHPISLGALSAARVSFPDFYGDLQDDPQLLGRLTALLVNEGSLMDQPVEAHALLLKRYVNHDKDSDITTVKEACRDLRQFLASLVGIRWPDSLQSILLLSEDPISRKFGAGANALFGLLVSGDTRGVIEQLSSRTDKISFSEDQAQLLHQLIGDLHLESAARRLNALRVVANLITYLPDRTKRLMLGKLCTELAASVSLRSMVGLDKIAAIVPLATAQEQRHIAAALIEDLLTINQKTEMRLISLESPSLEEAQKMALQACAIVLDVRLHYGLPERQDKIFKEWIKVRDVATATGAYHFGFGQLEQWITQYPEMLIEMLGEEYVSMLASEVAANRGGTIDLVTAAARVDQVFEGLAGVGQESRGTLWPLVVELISSPSLELQGSALTVLERHHPLASGHELSQCVKAVATVLHNHPKPETDYERGFRWLLPTATAKFESLEQDTREALAAFNIGLSQAESYETDSVALFEKVIKQDLTLVLEVTDTWVKWLPDELSMGCAMALFENYGLLDESAQTSIVTYLDTGFDATQTPMRYDRLYAMAVGSIPSTAWDSGILNAHLDRALGKLPGKVSNEIDELEPILVGISKVYLHGSATVIAGSLRDTFSNARSYPAQHNLVHQYFAGTWPTVEKIKPGYDPEIIFNQSITVGTRYPSEAGEGLLASLDSMVEAGLVGLESLGALVELACLIWQGHIAEAHPFLSETSAPLTSTQIITLPDAIDWTDLDEVKMLEEVWRNAGNHLDQAGKNAATIQLLSKGPLGTTDQPDQGLALWIKAIGTTSYAVLKDGVLNPEISDEARRRLWRQITSLSSQPEPVDLINLACRVLPSPDAPQIISQVVEDLGAILQRLPDQANRLEMSKQLMRSLPGCSLLTTKQSLAQYAFDLGTAAVLPFVDVTTLAEVDIEVIEGVFGKKANEVKALKRRFTKHHKA
ncbi:KAP family NTPase [Pseudomonas syringae pv. syringae]|uniref:KAP family P-loop NTPase fold protein n=1 Tax=Pseudomonas syringae TaxID=317 RepID=UPI00200AEA7E|nr:P-loop NTPase fold protein [Pseudomonas syringae]MCK9712309.1 KAP family NTPase [Pseudomonas syringae pv. syringae]